MKKPARQSGSPPAIRSLKKGSALAVTRSQRSSISVEGYFYGVTPAQQALAMVRGIALHGPASNSVTQGDLTQALVSIATGKEASRGQEIESITAIS